MIKLRYLLISSLLIFFVASCSDKDKDEYGVNKPLIPNNELRGTWVATAWGLDWPMGDYSEAAEKALYIKYLDILAENNMNAVIFQVRPMQGLFYESEYESWSQYITGTFGKDPNWDVMEFLINEAHKRGIEFHAWYNPYRIATRASANDAFPPLDPKIPENLVLDYATIRMYNPALPEVRDRFEGMIREVLSRYDVDGISIDDYFYPGDVSNLEDQEYFETYGEEGQTIQEFRRENVDKIIKKIKQAVVDVKPQVAFSVSPAGNNSYNYDVMYADILKWSREGWVDIMIPQIYYATGSPTNSGSFNGGLHWWSQFTYDNLLMVGYDITKFSPNATNDKYKSNIELTSQFDFAKTQRKVSGSVLYSAKYMVTNPVDIMESIKDAYKNPTVTPYIGRPSVDEPQVPSQLKISGNTLSWSSVDGAEKYGVYRSNGNNKVADMIAVINVTSFQMEEKGDYFVTAIGKYNVMSEMSEIATY